MLHYCQFGARLLRPVVIQNVARWRQQRRRDIAVRPVFAAVHRQPPVTMRSGLLVNVLKLVLDRAMRYTQPPSGLLAGQVMQSKKHDFPFPLRKTFPRLKRRRARRFPIHAFQRRAKRERARMTDSADALEFHAL